MPRIFRRGKVTKSKRRIVLRTQLGRPDLWLAASVAFLTLFGILMVYDASVVLAFRDFRDKFYFLKLQVGWAALGLLGGLLASFVDYRLLFRLAPLALFLTLILLLLVFAPSIGIEAYGARRWLNLRFFVLQPAELAKLTFVLYLSSWLFKKQNLRGFLLLLGILVGLVLLGKDLGTTIIILATGLVIYFVAGAPLAHFVLIIPFLVLGLVALIVKTPYRLRRVLVLFDPTRDPLGASYHMRQVLIALGSGGLLGLGIGQSRQKYQYLPAAMTDSIFAIIAEELGFVGATFVILVFFLVILRGFRIAQSAPDRFGELLGMGIVSWLAIQTLVNLASMVALVPLTGVPLPFISYGGSNLVVSLVGVGILLNISKQRVVKKERG